MRKFLATLLALTVVMSLGVSAFAASGSEANSGTNIESMPSSDTQIQVGLNATLPTPDASYYVTITWTDMRFTYTGSKAEGWNHENHTYSTAANATGSWSFSSSTVDVDNHSNVPVVASATYDAGSSGYTSGDAKDGVTVTVDDIDETTLNAGDTGNTTPSEGNNRAKATVTVTGTPKSSFNVVAGTITVELSEASS